MNKDDQLFLAAIKLGTHALGPGNRAAIWVQGCPFHCRECISPDWIKPGVETTNIQDIVDEIKKAPNIDGLTISGGEPMAQAKALTNLVQLVKAFREDINIICFTGYRYQDLIQRPPTPDIKGFLNEIDVLIDGPYIASKNDNIGLRGSSNQTIHFLTEKLTDFDFDNQPRKIEIEFHEGQAFIVGIPIRNFRKTWDYAISNFQRS
jgi:anaerobic ribonucleoside-triphosphate reductase activating protein